NMFVAPGSLMMLMVVVMGVTFTMTMVVIVVSTAATIAMIMGVRVGMVMLTVMMSIIGVAMFGYRTVTVLHAAIRQVRMVMMVAVDGKRLGSCRTEQTHI